MRTLGQIEEDLREAEHKVHEFNDFDALYAAHERALEDIRAFEHKVAEQDAIIDQLEAEAQLANEHASELEMVLGPEYVIATQPVQPHCVSWCKNEEHH